MTLIYWWTWASSKWIFKNFFRCRVYNPERVPTKGSVIIASNHESFIDPPFIGSSLSRPINYLARENIFSHWLSGPYFRRLNAVPVDRDGGVTWASLLSSCRQLQSADDVWFFGLFEVLFFGLIVL